MVVLAVTWMANPGKEVEVAGIFRELENASRLEPGCLMYIVHQHQTQPRRFFIYEQYVNREALESHWNSAHFHKYAVEALAGIGERVEGELYSPISPEGSSK